MKKKVHVQANINGSDTEFLCEPRQSLLEEWQPARLEGRRNLEKIAGPVNINSSSRTQRPHSRSHAEPSAHRELRP